jgi:hypothetical protein
LVRPYGEGEKNFLDELESYGASKIIGQDGVLGFYMLQQGTFGEAVLEDVEGAIKSYGKNYESKVFSRLFHH